MKSKTHYLLLDALRGIAAMIVLFYHLFEGYGYEVAEGTGIYTQVCDHGYLAVDLFFLLSGFVISYAYDDRMNNPQTSMAERKLTFFKRRLIRLHPMVVLSVLLGAITFCIQGATQWDFDGTGNPVKVGFFMLLLAMMLNMFMLPNVPGQPFEVRGNGELFPLNGPHWSLFFEYIGNILYAILFYRMKTNLLKMIVILTGILQAWFVIDSGYLGVGWTLGDFWTGMLRMIFPYTFGMLLARTYITKKDSMVVSKYTFLICSVVLIVLLSMPFVGAPSKPWQNGLYIVVLTSVVFPMIVWYSAKASECLHVGASLQKFYKYIGELSYPLYAMHYPIMYLFFWYIGFPNVNKPINEVWPVAISVFILNILISTAALYLYDKPVRRWLSKRFIADS